MELQHWLVPKETFNMKKILCAWLIMGTLTVGYFAHRIKDPIDIELASVMFAASPIIFPVIVVDLLFDGNRKCLFNCP